MTTPETDAASAEGTVIVTETGSGTFTRKMTAGRHELIADEPAPVGDDAGPTPYDLLLSALGPASPSRYGCMPTARAGRWSRFESRCGTSTFMPRTVPTARRPTETSTTLNASGCSRSPNV